MAARIAASAGAIAVLLWFMLDSGLVTPERAARSTSVALAVLGTLFGVGAWATAAAGQRERSPLLARGSNDRYAPVRSWEAPAVQAAPAARSGYVAAATPAGLGDVTGVVTDGDASDTTGRAPASRGDAAE